MQELDFSHLHVTFFKDAKLNKHKSELEGRKVFDDVEKIKIQIAGDKNSVLVAPVEDQSSVRDPETGRRLKYRELHEKRYEAWKNGQAFTEGTPLEVADFISKGKVAELKAMNIHSLEQIAGLDGSALEKLGMGYRELKNRSEAFLSKSANSSGIAELANENDELKNRIAALEAMMSEKQAETGQPVADQSNPFNDMDKDTIEVWMRENGGNFDARWSENTARLKAHEHNQALAKQEAA